LITEIGIRNLLAHFEIIDEKPISCEDRGLPPTRLMHMPDSDCYLISNDAGIYETLIDLDQPVKKGDAVGQVHFPEKLELQPVVYCAGRDGTLIGRTHKPLVGIGDFLGMIATEM
jgi:N-alpha-acetyl-L-2,4-diaminobutyrate deacetylase